jgi:hypothetical protein
VSQRRAAVARARLGERRRVEPPPVPHRAVVRDPRHVLPAASSAHRVTATATAACERRESAERTNESQAIHCTGTGGVEEKLVVREEAAHVTQKPCRWHCGELLDASPSPSGIYNGRTEHEVHRVCLPYTVCTLLTWALFISPRMPIPYPRHGVVLFS